MGVKDLWNIISPVGKKITLFDCQGQKVAIDISPWVCEGLSVGGRYPSQPRQYLSNVLFRTNILLMLNITPIFVLDGEAPELKNSEIVRRLKGRYKTDGENANVDPNKKVKRRQLTAMSNICCQLLKTMGVQCIQSDGEAEALCAQLNKEGIVHAVITQDSDTFLYGAKTVYRNFNIQGSGGTLDVYNLDDIESTLNLTREKLIAMSLLCGCDYKTGGVHGVGKETAYRYLELLPEGNVLDHLRSWRSDKRLERYESQRLNCSKCSHPGKQKIHNKEGCPDCYLSSGCDEDLSPLSYKNLSEEEKKFTDLELSLRRKALADPEFPDEETIKEFINFCQTLSEMNFQWGQPDIIRFLRFTGKYLNWEEFYGFQKIVPLCTRWQLLNSNNQDFVPVKILKKRVYKGTPCFEVSWAVNNENIKALTAVFKEENEFFNNGHVVTIEPQELIIKKYEQLYQSYIKEIEDKKSSKRKTTKKKKKETATLDKYFKVKKSPEISVLKDNTNQVKCLNLEDVTQGMASLKLTTNSESHSVNSCNSEIEAVKTDDFTERIKKMMAASKAKDTSITENSDFSYLQNETENLSIGNDESVQSTNGTLDLDDSTTQDYELSPDFDISLIVNNIISRKTFY